MTRPQTENLNAYDVEPVAWQVDGMPHGATVRALNEDQETGALSALVHLPKGWEWGRQRFCEADQDLFVIEGKLRAGKHILSSGAFSFFPAGALQEAWVVDDEVTAFVIFSRKPKFEHASESLSDASVENTVAYLDTWQMDWFDPLSASKPSEPFHPGIFIKQLRVDRETGTSTHLAGLMPGWFQEGIEVHPVREESIILSGDVNIATVGGNDGYTLTVGGYYSRPPGIPHGPLSSKNGNVGLVHTDGLLGIDYQDEPQANNMILDHLRSFPWK